MGLREEAEQARKDYIADLEKKQKEHIEKVFGRESESLGNGYFKIDDLIFDVTVLPLSAEIRMAMLCKQCKKPMTIYRKYGWCQTDYKVENLLGLAGILDDYYVQSEMKDALCYRCAHPNIGAPISEASAQPVGTKRRWWQI